MKSIENYLENHRLIFFLLLFCITAGVFYLFRNTGLICDENQHYRQILSFLQGDFRMPDIPSTAGYHALMAALMKLTGLSSLFAARCISLVFSFSSAFTFYLLAKRIQPGHAVFRTLQYFFFPAIFIYYFMVYTDLLSLLMVLLMLLFALDKRYAMAGFFGILSMLVRQNNVIWVAFIPAIVYYEAYGLSISTKGITETARKTWVFFLGMALFILFVILNKGVAIGDASSHPSFTFTTGNLFFPLFCIFVFFLPMHIANIPQIIRYFTRSKWPALLSVLLFLVYWFTFRFDHPYNSVGGGYFIRNALLMRLNNSSIRIVLFFIPLIFTFWSLVVTPLSKKSWYLFYIFTVLFLLPVWLIEQRYYIIPFMLFMLFRKEQSYKVELFSIIYYIAILCWLIPGVISLKYIF